MMCPTMNPSPSASEPDEDESAEKQLLGGQPESDQEARGAGLIRLKIAKLAGEEDTTPIQEALEAVAGVSAARIDSAANEAIIEHQGADEQALIAALKGQGYIATLE